MWRKREKLRGKKKLRGNNESFNKWCEICKKKKNHEIEIFWNKGRSLCYNCKRCLKGLSLWQSST